MERDHAPALSIITVCRNIEGEIEDTCRSVATQTFTDFEWIVIDGASTDGTREILEKYSDKMAVFVSEPDSGIYNAMNKGIRLAKGEYLLFLNGGDYLVSKTVLAEVFSRKLEADICYGNVYDLYPFDNTVTLMEAHSERYLSKLYFVCSTICHQAAFIKRSLFLQFGAYNENLRIVSDWEKWIEFIENGCSFSKLKITVSVFRLGGISTTQFDMANGEKQKVLSRYFTTMEIRQARRLWRRVKYKELWSLGRWGEFSVASIKECEGMRVYSFMCVPFLKVRWRRDKDSESYRLFGFIPIWKAKRKGSNFRENHLQVINAED